MKYVAVFLFFPGILAVAWFSDSLARPGCGQSAWAHVYRPERLQILEPCIEVTGHIVKRRAEPDGDFHLELALDPPRPLLLNEKNLERQGGNLVLEIVCAREPTQKDAIEPCRGYVNDLIVPSVGDNVRVSGPLVLDTEGGHGWVEIHPVASLQILGNARSRRLEPSGPPRSLVLAATQRKGLREHGMMVIEMDCDRDPKHLTEAMQLCHGFMGVEVTTKGAPAVRILAAGEITLQFRDDGGVRLTGEATDAEIRTLSGKGE